jgi:hypothetical protein
MRLGALNENVLVVDAAHFGWNSDFARWEGELGTAITVGGLRAKLTAWGMTGAMENAVLLTWAALGNWDIAGVDRPTLQSLPDGAGLRKANLPTVEDWDIAKARAAGVFGVPPENALAPRAVARFAAAVRSAASGNAVADLVQQLEKHADVLGIEENAGNARLMTARRVNDLVATIDRTRTDKELVDAVATFDLPAELVSFGRAFHTAPRLASELAGLDWGIIAAAQTRADAAFRTSLASLRAAAAVDESVASLEPRLRDLAVRARALVVAPVAPLPGPAPSPTPSVSPSTVHPTEASGTRRASLTDLDQMLAELKKEIGEQAGSESMVTISWQIDR